jgi:hypothetical protein
MSSRSETDALARWLSLAHRIERKLKAFGRARFLPRALVSGPIVVDYKLVPRQSPDKDAREATRTFVRELHEYLSSEAPTKKPCFESSRQKKRARRAA